MKYNLKKKRYILLAFIILAGAAIYFGGNIYVKNRLEKKLGELINTDDNTLYNYSLGSFSIEVLSGTVKLSKISIKPTEFALASVKNNENDLRVVGDFSIEEILFEEFEIKTFFETGKIELKQFKILNPSFTIHHNIKKQTSDSSTVLESTLSDKFISAYLGKLNVINANLTFKEINATGSDLNVQNINILLTESYVDPQTIKKSFPFDFKNITLSSDGLYIDVSDEYEIKSKDISFNMQSKSFTVDSFKLIPKHSHKELEKINKYNVGEYQFDADKLIIEGFNFDTFKYKGKLELSTVKLINNHLVLYSNKNKPYPPKKEKILWATALNKIPLSFSIDSLIIENSTINIHEKSEITQRVSHLFFEEMNVSITGFSSDSATTQEQNFMMVKANTKFLGKGKAEFFMKVDLTSLDDNYWATGKMGPMNVVEFNQILTPLFNINATGGKINHASFSYFANNNKAKGVIDLEYEDLKMELLTNKSKHKKNRFASMVVNTIIKQNNIKSKNSYKQGIISAERNKNKSSFNYLWKALQSGIVSTLVPDRVLKKINSKK